MHWRRKWQPTPVFLPRESQGWGSLVATVYGVAQSRTQLKRLSSSSSSKVLHSSSQYMYVCIDKESIKLTHWKRPWWSWARLKAGTEGDNRGRDDWMASPIQWTWVWANSWRWWRTGKPGVLQSMGLQRSGTTEELNNNIIKNLHILSILFIKKILFSVFIYLAAPGLGCHIWDLVPWPGIEPGPPALGVQS